MSRVAILSTDGRSEFQRMSRREIWRALKNANIPHKAGCTSEDGIKLLQANQVNPMEVIEWEQVQVQDEKGNTTIQNHPKRVQPQHSEHELLKREEEMQKRLDEATENEKASNEKANVLETQMKALADQVEMLTKALLEKESKPKKTKESDPHKMKYMAFKKWCKDRGHELQKGENKEDIIAKLEATDENIT
jgi:hypothetical protein